MRLYLALFSMGMLLLSCRSDVRIPKPEGFHRIELPKHTYQPYDDSNCPVVFDLPTYAATDIRKPDSCWVNFHFKPLNCYWHLTYKNLREARITPQAAFEDYRRLIYKHSQRATEITETALKTPNGSGVLFQIYGNVPTSAQIFFSDSVNHAVMMSFYFNTALKNDSLAPIIEFVKEDMKHLIESLAWKK